ncbi:hypothetical protein ACLGEE_04990 [Helicobacter pylori]
MDLKNKSFRSHTAYTSALKNDLLLNPSLVEAERNFTSFWNGSILKWILIIKWVIKKLDWGDKNIKGIRNQADTL